MRYQGRREDGLQPATFIEIRKRLAECSASRSRQIDSQIQSSKSKNWDFFYEFVPLTQWHIHDYVRKLFTLDDK